MTTINIQDQIWLSWIMSLHWKIKIFGFYDLTLVSFCQLFLFLFLHNTQVKFELSYCSISYFVEKCQMWGFHALASVSFDQILLKNFVQCFNNRSSSIFYFMLVMIPKLSPFILAGSRDPCPLDIFFFVFFQYKINI